MQQIPSINAELASQCMMHWLVSIPPQQSKACRLPVLKGTGTLLAAPAAQAGLAAAETQQPMRTRPTAWVRERGAAAMRARPERYGAVKSGVKGPPISDMASQQIPRSKARRIVNSVCLGKAAPTHARLLWLACSAW